MIVDSKRSELSTLDRLFRAVNFYSTAVPVFAAYKALETSLQLKRNLLQETLSAEEEEVLYQNLHEWGSEAITEKIKLLKGFYVKTGQIISTRVSLASVYLPVDCQYDESCYAKLGGHLPTTIHFQALNHARCLRSSRW
jgi:hypothetical protein